MRCHRQRPKRPAGSCSRRRPRPAPGAPGAAGCRPAAGVSAPAAPGRSGPRGGRPSRTTPANIRSCPVVRASSPVIRAIGQPRLGDGPGDDRLSICLDLCRHLVEEGGPILWARRAVGLEGHLGRRGRELELLVVDEGVGGLEGLAGGRLYADQALRRADESLAGDDRVAFKGGGHGGSPQAMAGGAGSADLAS